MLPLKYLIGDKLSCDLAFIFFALMFFFSADLNLSGTLRQDPGPGTVPVSLPVSGPDQKPLPTKMLTYSDTVQYDKARKKTIGSTNNTKQRHEC